LKPFPQQIFSTATTSIGKLLKKNCGDAEGKKTALKLLSCATPDRVKEGQQCAVGTLDAIQKLSESAANKTSLIPKVCCLAHVSSDCARQKLGKITCPDPTIKPIEHFEESMNALTRDTMDLACENYKTLASCEAQIPEEVAKLKEILKNAPYTFGSRSLIKPMLEIADKIAN